MVEKEDIAIVGVGCRFPGADNLDEFWRVLSKGENHVLDVPPDRWNVDAWYDPDAPGKTYARTAGIVKGHDEFDYRLYGISEAEGIKMDPQQRFTLDCVAMALEDGGFTKDQLKGSKTGVYMGVMNADYLQVAGKDFVLTDSYTLTGSANSIVAARVSYVYDLHGPAVSLDTACSSALVAIHLASQALRTGDCDLALAGGVNGIMIHDTMIPLIKARMISRIGQCQAFSEDADGYARGEGCGVVVLKRLSDALKDKDKIWSTIITGANQDGHMVQPISAPSGVQQEKLLHEMYRRHEIDTSTVQYIEAHGTGTPIGDPTEVNSLGSFFGNDVKKRHIGSVKTNIGHLESAAGTAGLIKVLLMMKHQTIVPSLHSSKFNRKIDFLKYQFEVPHDCIPWKELPTGGRAACVNSFGFGGTNCHAYVKQHMSKASAQTVSPGDNGHRMIVLSSHTSEGLKANILHLSDSAKQKHFDMDSLSFTSSCRRDHREFRLAFHANDQDELITQLETDSPLKLSHRPDNLRVIYVFCGMGTAWKGMCKDFLDIRIFRETLEEIDKLLKEYKSISVIQELKDETNIHDPAIEPLVLFACQVGLMAIWRHWGVEPAAVVGQSVGEVAAAYVAGILSLKVAVLVIYHRTRLLLQSRGGKMLVVRNYPVDKVEGLCAQHKNRVNIAVYNSSNCCTISGEDETVTSVKAEIETGDISEIILKELGVKTAYHCHKQRPLAKQLTDELKGLKGRSPTFDIISTVTGTRAAEGDFGSPEYWARNMTEPVRFHQAMLDVADKSKANVFIEVGPSPVLRAHFDDIFGDSNGTVISSMTRGENINVMLQGLGKLFSLGINPDWSKITPPIVQEITSEPQYQFQRIKGLFEPEISLLERQGLGKLSSKHPYVSRVSGNSPTFEVRINEKETPFVYAHVVGGASYVPGAFFADTAFVYGTEVFETVPQELRVSFRLLKPVVAKEGNEQKLTILTDTHSVNKACFKIMHKKSTCVFGEVEIDNEPALPKQLDIGAVRRRCNSKMSRDEIYRRLKLYGFQYGESLQLLTKCECNSIECVAWLRLSELVRSQMRKTHLHPSVLDAIIQSTIYSGRDSNITDTMPIILSSVKLYTYITEDMVCYSKRTHQRKDATHFNILLLTNSGQVIAEIEDLVIKTSRDDEVTVDDLEYSFYWFPAEMSRQEPQTGQILTASGKEMPCELRNKLSTILVHPFDVKKAVGIMTTGSLKDRLLAQCRSGQLTQVDGICGIVYFEMFFSDQSAGVTESMDNVARSFSDLRELLCFLSQNDIRIPLTVVTYRTQTPSNISSDLEVRLDGAFLWGLVRCFVREDNIRVQLIDLSDMNTPTLKTFEHCVKLFNSEDLQLKETLICNGESYKSVVRSSRRVVPILHRSTNREGVTEPLRLVNHGKRPQNPSGFYLEYLPEEEKSTQSEKMLTISVQTVVIPREDMMSDRNNHTPIHGNAKNGDRVLCLEALGYLNTDPTRKVIVPIPAIPATVISTHEDCTFPKSLMKNYKPGLLTCFMLIEKVALCVTKESYVTIVTENETCPFGKLLIAVLSQKGCKNVGISLNSETENIPSATECFILLSPCQLEIILSSNHKTKEVIAVSGFGGECDVERASLTTPGVIYKIITLRDVLQISQVPRALKEISKMMSKQPGKFNEILRSFKDTHLLLFVLHVVDFTGDKQPSVYMTEKTLFRKNGCYVVVGGLTGLGWLLVRFVAERSGGLVAIMSRRPLDTECSEKIKKLRNQTGTAIDFLQADVCDISSIESAFCDLQARYPNKPIRGIFQGAGVLKDSLLINSTLEDFELVSAPKIKGTVNLHIVSVKMDLKLDYFILHSSIASIFGSTGQTNYGAANSFLDTFSNYRRQKGLPAQAINWGPLAVGMAVRNETIEKSWRSAGFQEINEKRISDCLTRALLANNSSVCFVNIDRLQTQLNLLAAEDIRQELDASTNSHITNSVVDLEIDIPGFQAMDRLQRREALWNYITRLVERMFPFSSESFLQSTLLSSLGLNSLNALSLSNQLKSDTGISIPATRLISEDLTIENLLVEVENRLMNHEVHLNGALLRNSEDVYLKLSRHVSPMQEFIYRDYQQHYNNNDMLEMTELKLPILLSVNGLKSILNKMIQRHQPLRTLYKLTDSGISPNVLENFEVPEIVVLESDDHEYVKGEIQRIYRQPFELHSELPFRVVFNPSEHSPRIWFIFHPITFDQKAINIFFKEFKTLAMNDEMVPIEEVNIPEEVFKVLIPQFQELSHFWKAHFNRDTQISFLSLSESSQVDYTPSALENKTHWEIHSDLVKQVSETCKELKITMFHFLVCTFKLLWHLLTGENRIGFLIEADTRQHVPALMNVITRCSNYLPVTGYFVEGSTIESCLQSTSSEVKGFVHHGLYPGFLVLQNLATEAAANVCRHKIVMEDLTDQLDLSENTDTEVGQAGPMGLHQEIRLLLWTSEKHSILKLQLDYHPKIVTQKAAELFLSDFEALMCFMTTKSSTLIGDIPLSLIQSSVRRSVKLPYPSAHLDMSKSVKPLAEPPFTKDKNWRTPPYSSSHNGKSVGLSSVSIKNVLQVNPQTFRGELAHTHTSPDHAKTTHQSYSPHVSAFTRDERHPASISAHTDRVTWPDPDFTTLIRGSWFIMKTGFGCCLSSWHDVLLQVSHRSGRPDYLVWGIEENCPTEKVPIAQIKKVDLSSASGRHMLKIQTLNKTTIFRPTNLAEARNWTAALNRLLHGRDQDVYYENEGAFFEDEITAL